jgi:hypothetical protein
MKPETLPVTDTVVNTLNTLDCGEHGWRVYPRDPVLVRLAASLGHPEPRVDHQSVRVRAGWGREVAHIAVRSDVDGNPFIAVSKQERMKTKALYAQRRGSVDIHDAEDYRRFLQAFIEAGQRAGFIES